MELVPCLQAGSMYGNFCFSEDSKYIFCCCGSEVKVYNTSNGECLRDLKGHTLKVTGVFLNPTNVLQVVSCGQDGLLIYWDYLDGVKLKEYNLHIPLYGIVSINGDKKSLMMIAQTSGHKKAFSLMRWKKLKPSFTEFGPPSTLIEHCPGDSRLISFGCSREIVASALGPQVTVYSMKKESRTFLRDKEKYNQRKAVTCLACHPSEYIVACGYDSGKIILWHNILQSNPVPSLRHWHALPVLCLDFSVDGSIFLSGGHECVLVRWQMNNAQQKDFKPRMGAPITHVLSSPDGSLYASRHADNVVQLMNINLKVLQVYRGLTRGNSSLTSDPTVEHNPIPCGLTYDPRSRALVTNGLPGHLQFYSLALGKQLFNLDIVGQNYISPETIDRPTVITAVTSTAISADGLWLSTFESWDDGYFSPEQRLKFWVWSSESQTYALNTTVESPHEGEVTSLVFRPPRPACPPTLASLGSDSCFKLWALEDDSDIYRSNTRWSCDCVGEYRGLGAQSADFSTDGSVLAVAFDHLLTLWDPDRNVVRSVLCSSLEKETLHTVKFGSHSCQRYLVAVTENVMLAWDIFTVTIVWKMTVDNPILFKDPSSDLMAFVTNSSKLSVFRPSSQSVLYEHASVSQSRVLTAIFVPEGRDAGLQGQGWPGQSQIYLFNTDQELVTLDCPLRRGQSDKHVRIAQDLPTSALSALMAEQVVRETRDTTQPSQSYAISGPQTSTTMPVLNSNEPVSLYCKQYLRNIWTRRKPSKHSSQSVSSEEEDGESSGSDMEVESLGRSGNAPSQNPTQVGGGEVKKQTNIKEKLLNRPPQADWVQWCAALKLK